MARRQIGQEHLALGGVAALIDWAEIDRLLAGISASTKGEPGWPPLALFKALLLATWHDLSDVRLAEALDDRASFRRFCGFAAHEPTPERTAFVRFRRELVRRGLDRVLFEAVTRQLEAKGVMVRAGTLVDATLIPSASIRADSEACWAGHRRRTARALPHREGVRHLQAQLRPAPDALARPGQGGAAGPSRRYGLQPPAHGHLATRRGGLMRGESARVTPSAPTEAEFGAHHGAQGSRRPEARTTEPSGLSAASAHTSPN